jgi:Predicted membrane protein (DUF2207)
MKKILLPLLLFLILNLFLSLNLGTAKAQYKGNYTDNIKVEIIENNQDMLLNYTITHAFSPNSNARHGIFLDLSKNQDNVVYNYKLIAEAKLDGYNVKYEIISELTSFRIRFGDKDVQVSPGIHSYQFTIKTNLNKDYNHKFIPFYGWQDQLNSVNVIYQGEDICLEIDCVNNVYINFNPEKTKANPILAIILVFQYYFCAVLGSMALWFGVLRSKFKDPYRVNMTNGIPFYTSPKDMLPWDIESIINRGHMNVKDTLAAYILYLNHKKIIQITPVSDKLKQVSIKLIGELPNFWLPASYNKIIYSLIEHGVEKGLKESQIQEYNLSKETEEFILGKNESYYSTIPNIHALPETIIATICCGLLLTILYNFLKPYLLIGTSAFVFIIFCFLITMIFLFLYLNNKDKFTAEGNEIFKEASGYKYYLKLIEKEKLNFDNNPEEGAKFYLTNVPYAAQFGFLKKFNKYFQSLNFIESESITTSVILVNSLNRSSFFIPPNDSNYGGGVNSGSGGFSGGGGSW